MGALFQTNPLNEYNLTLKAEKISRFPSLKFLCLFKSKEKYLEGNADFSNHNLRKKLPSDLYDEVKLQPKI